MKYIVVTGGVLSGLGKGITASSIALLMKCCGHKVTMIKIDPYLNCDAGTMNPYQHGEVFVLDDGGEVDLDLGNYERFLDINLTREHNITTGKVYGAVIEKERRGDYLGKTVQIIPHITDEIRNRIKDVAKKSKADISIVELGGTVGDIESMPFLEALRQLHNEVGSENLIFVHTTLVPVIGAVGEQKTKPTQHSVKELMSLGIQPDIIVCRSTKPLGWDIREKISNFCSVPFDAVVSVHDLSNTYAVPLLLHKQGLTKHVLKALKRPNITPDLSKWKSFVKKTEDCKKNITIAMIGKYTNLKDSYISYIKAFQHAGAECGAKIEIKWIEAEALEHLSPQNGKGKYFAKTHTSNNHTYNEELMKRELNDVHGIVIPGGFGERGILGKLRTIRYARENKIPFLGVCLGFQLTVIEFCRNVLGMDGSNSTEFDPKTKYPVVYILPEQKGVDKLGGTMRLGTLPTKIKKGSLAHRLYKKTDISERHRHRYEVNPAYIKKVESHGLRFTGKSPDGRRMEIAELTTHPFFIASQFHPELKSRPGKTAPLFLGLAKACLEYSKD
ncbi:MAG: CTP synthase (glutamine hydrolyzing) [Thermoplasmata archaeon]